MIIKYTLEDNDFTQVIEKYLDGYGLFNSFNYNSYKELDEFKKLIRQYDDYNDKYIEEKDLTKEGFKKIKEKLLELAKESFTIYIKENSRWSTDGITAQDLQDYKEYILNNINISIVRSFKDQWENGEVVYYITSNQKYIIM